MNDIIPFQEHLLLMEPHEQEVLWIKGKAFVITPASIDESLMQDVWLLINPSDMVILIVNHSKGLHLFQGQSNAMQKMFYKLPRISFFQKVSIVLARINTRLQLSL
jgi:hypothetical protein